MADTPMGDAKQAARAIDALRRGWPVAIAGLNAKMTLLAVETAAADRIDKGSVLLISSARAATLKLTNQAAAADTGIPVIIDCASSDYSPMAIIDPTLDLTTPMKGPFRAHNLPDEAAGLAAMELARLAAIMPGFIVMDDSEADVIITPADIAAYQDNQNLHIASRARLPVAAAPDAQLVIFRSDADASDHAALIIGQRDGSPPVVRLHSECLTGDVLGSLKCDCGPQLHEALHQIAHAQWGILLYLRQEGRGIGLVNKLRAYALQDQGFDTVDANIRLGFAIDARDFGVAARMLSLLNVDSVKLLTNNPEKVTGLEAQDIKVVERISLKIAANPHNADYLETKRTRTGHKL